MDLSTRRFYTALTALYLTPKTLCSVTEHTGLKVLFTITIRWNSDVEYSKSQSGILSLRERISEDFRVYGSWTTYLFVLLAIQTLLSVSTLQAWIVHSRLQTLDGRLLRLTFCECGLRTDTKICFPEADRPKPQLGTIAAPRQQCREERLQFEDIWHRFMRTNRHKHANKQRASFRVIESWRRTSRRRRNCAGEGWSDMGW